MNYAEEEQRLKLHLLHSLARSQRALARILESMTEVTEQSGSAGRLLGENIQAIAGFQQAIAVKMIGIRLRKLRRGTPGRPWLAAGIRRKG